MCIVCKLWQQEIITTKEAKKAAWEMVNTKDADELHLQELYDKLMEQEREEQGYEQID